jgi:hypothetical protein
MDMVGNVSSWETLSNPPINPDFFVYNPASGIILQDTTTNYTIAGPSCAGTCDFKPVVQSLPRLAELQHHEDHVQLDEQRIHHLRQRDLRRRNLHHQ